MQLGIFAKVFPGTAPAAVLGAARRAGYRAVQYNMACSGLTSLPAAIPSQTAAAIAEAAAETGIAIAAVSATYNMIHPDPTERAKGRQAFQAIASAARGMGTRLLTLCTGTLDAHDPWRYHPGNSSAQAWSELCREFAFLLPIAEEHDVFVGVEPELANVINSAQRARELLDTLQSARIRIVFDAANLFDIADLPTQRAIVSRAVDLLADSIAIAHAKDRQPDGRIAAPGEGVLDYPHYLACLKNGGFHGPMIAHGLVPALLRREIAAS